MTLSSAYIELFIRRGEIRGEISGGNVRIPFHKQRKTYCNSRDNSRSHNQFKFANFGQTNQDI